MLPLIIQLIPPSDNLSEIQSGYGTFLLKMFMWYPLTYKKSPEFFMVAYTYLP